MTRSFNSLKGRRMKIAIRMLTIAGVVLSLSGLSGADETLLADEKKPDAKAAAAGAAKPEAAKKEESKDPEKPFADVVKDMEVREGLFTFYVKADENKAMLEIKPEQFGKVFLFAGSVDQAIGERGFYAAQMGADFPFVFRRVGKRVQWVLKNTSFSADKGTPSARFIARSFPDAVIGSAKVASRPHPERKSILIDASELFSTDLPGLAAALSRAYEPTAYKFDRDN